MEATLHVDEGIRAAPVESAAIVALCLAGMIPPAPCLFPKLPQRTPHPHQLLTCHGQEYIASPKPGEANY